jgi:hypothetical protein
MFNTNSNAVSIPESLPHKRYNVPERKGNQSDRSKNILKYEQNVINLPSVSEEQALPLVAQSDVHLDEMSYFPVTVDSSLGSQLIKAVSQSCGKSLEYVKVEPRPRDHQSRIWLSLQTAVLGVAIHAIILALPSAEIGRISHSYFAR